MTPAVTEAAGQNDELKILARGFVALLEIARKLTRQEQVLQSRLQYAFDEVCNVLLYFSLPTYHPPQPPLPNDEKNPISSRSRVAHAAMNDYHVLSDGFIN